MFIKKIIYSILTQKIFNNYEKYIKIINKLFLIMILQLIIFDINLFLPIHY